LEEAGERNRQRALKETRRPDVETFVNSDLSDAELIDAVGADRATLQNWLKENPSPTAVFKPERDGEIAVQERGRRLKQQEFRRSEIGAQNASYAPASSGESSGMLSTPASSGGSSSMMPSSTSGSNLSPVSSMPQSAAVYPASSENAMLNMGGGYVDSVTPIVASSINNTSTDDVISAPASIRDSTVILSRVFRQSSAYV
jgi:hypothetical protein